MQRVLQLDKFKQEIVVLKGVIINIPLKPLSKVDNLKIYINRLLGNQLNKFNLRLKKGKIFRNISTALIVDIN